VTCINKSLFPFSGSLLLSLSPLPAPSYIDCVLLCRGQIDPESEVVYVMEAAVTKSVRRTGLWGLEGPFLAEDSQQPVFSRFKSNYDRPTHA
jgi:hypothetical protein